MLNEHLIKWLSRDVADKSTGSTTRPSIAIATDIGLVRKENQDRVACMMFSPKVGQGQPFFVVALSDGMGGMKDGGQCAVRTISTFFSSLACYRDLSLIERLRNAAKEANSNVFSYSGGYGGATLSAVLISLDGSAITLNMGDSRIYAESGSSIKILERLTVDDSLEEMVGGHGRGLLQFVGMGGDIKPHVKYITPEFDKLLITSDGVHFISHDTLEAVFVNSSESAQIVSRLSALARWSGGPDNSSLAAFSIGKIEEMLKEAKAEDLVFWDSFSELNLVWFKREACIAVDSISVVPEKVEARDVLQSELVLNKISSAVVSESSIAKKSTRKRNSKPRAPKKTQDKLQIIIEMDANMESGDDSSR